MAEDNLILDLTDKLDYEFSVSEISNRIKELLENNFGYIRIKGEISGLKIATSGHGYFNLKENNAILACTCWRPVLARINFTPQDGMEIVARGKLSGYAGNSRYQLSVETLQQAGLGAFMQILKERHEKLAKEGIFDKPKKSLPFLPNKIGVITSLTGAVIKDIIHRIKDRYPSHVIIWPVTVQGENAANEIANAITGFNKLDYHIRPSVIIIARGGGSTEDLWAFNEEIVVRSAFNSVIPIISAVGHETDNTLIDLVADKRAPTPTAAAEFAVPVIANLIHTVRSYYEALISRINQFIKYAQQDISYNTDLKKSLNTRVDYNQQLLDELSFRLLDSLPNLLKFKSAKLETLGIERLNPIKIIEYQELELRHQVNYMLRSIKIQIQNYDHQLNLSNSLLTSLDYKTVLRRGFAVIRSEDGNFITSKSAANKTQEFNIHFFDGNIAVRCK
ncbi:exodeoxyribonuclease VII large subunit [Candidatus Tisiphia endosymbiont of Beris chalybata]|uniref:exodeoxyribonuclease VII large subunit n=1 Tax=Candidatus Tisiphia endosymbiont of Beris chalybata TaxID=3066262 RepID=UPI00312C8181